MDAKFLLPVLFIRQAIIESLSWCWLSQAGCVACALADDAEPCCSLCWHAGQIWQCTIPLAAGGTFIVAEDSVSRHRRY